MNRPRSALKWDRSSYCLKLVADSQKSNRSLAGIAGIVAVATLVSKVIGLLRQQAIAAAFGVGPAVGAYNYAYIIPGFLFVLLGGINGPFHSAIVSVLSKRSKEEAAPLVETITTLVGGALILVTIGLVVFADPLMDLVAPGLTINPADLQGTNIQGMDPEQLQALVVAKAQTREIAVQQFRIMAPMAVLAGLIGIGFGTLNASDQYWLPSISPLLSSLTLMAGLGILALSVGNNITTPDYALLGGVVLAWGTLGGATLQWLAQVVAQWRSGLGKLRLRFNLQQPGVKEVLVIMGPATLASGMLQINVFTDMFFTSFLTDPAASVSSLTYASLLVQAPLGIISSVILVPFLPVFSRLAAPENWPELKDRIRQGLMLTALTMLPLSAIIVPLAFPIVRVVYERYAFDAAASQLTASVLIVYAVGMFVYLGRDVLVRVFYGLGDGNTPFRISVANIFLNALLDFLLIRFETPGLVMATVGVNLISMIILLVLLNQKLRGLPWGTWSRPFLGLAIASGVTGFACWGTRLGCERLLGTEGFLIQLLQLSIASAVGLGIFAGFAVWLKIPEVDQITDRLRQKFLRR